MVAILLTPEIRSALESAEATNKIQRSSTVETISHTDLAAALRAVSHAPTLHSLLQTSEIHTTHSAAVTKHLPPKRNPQLEARVSRLRARLQDAEYARMVRDVARVDASNAEIEDARMGKFAPQMALGFNVVVTMATCFVAGYFVCKHTSGSDIFGLVGGVAGMIVAMGVEIVLVLTRMYRIDDAVSKHVKRRQRAAERSAS